MTVQPWSKGRSRCPSPASSLEKLRALPHWEVKPKQQKKSRPLLGDLLPWEWLLFLLATALSGQRKEENSFAPSPYIHGPCEYLSGRGSLGFPKRNGNVTTSPSYVPPKERPSKGHWGQGVGWIEISTGSREGALESLWIQHLTTHFFLFRPNTLD